LDQLTRREGLESLKQGGYQQPERLHPVRRGDENDDGDWKTAEVLLVFQILVGRQKGVEVSGRQLKEFTVRLPPQPIAATVRTSCSGSSRASGRGNDSSSRMRTGSQQIFGEFKRRDCLVTLHSRKVVEELIQRISGGQVVEEILYRHARSSEDRCAPEDLGIDLDHGVRCAHVGYHTPLPPGCRRRVSEAGLKDEPGADSKPG
jgi:hypothetical protein